MTFLEEAEHRIKCCIEQTPDDYGDLFSLGNFIYNKDVECRISELQKYERIWKDETALELLEELKGILDVQERAKKLFA